MRVEFKVDYKIGTDNELYSEKIVVDDSNDVMDMVNEVIGQFNSLMRMNKEQNVVIYGIICEGYAEED